MDEPFSSLDEITARKMRAELLRIWQETGKTVVFVTHDIAESVFLSQSILIVTQKPCTLSSRVEVPVPYPRQYGDDRLFEIEKHALREFLKMDGTS
jgi:ABC-type nitrate/sulfonate/bicarbonate transport system ATPase subunit